MEIYSQLYGLKHVNYNVHSLLHLPNYVRLYGPLDCWSGYIYENFLQEMKKNVKSGVNIAQQIKNRIVERSHLNMQYLKFGLTSKNEDLFPRCTNYKSFRYNSHTFN